MLPFLAFLAAYIYEGTKILSPYRTGNSFTPAGVQAH